MTDKITIEIGKRYKFKIGSGCYNTVGGTFDETYVNSMFYTCCNEQGNLIENRDNDNDMFFIGTVTEIDNDQIILCDIIYL